MPNPSCSAIIQPQADVVWCPNRLYMNQGFLSNVKKCNCEWEIEDLFAGSTGVSFRGFFCSFNPDKVEG